MTNISYSCLDSFYFSQFRIVVEAEQMVIVPEFKGSTIHGAFGHALQKIVCPFKYKQCRPDCIIHDSGQCFYQYIFKTRVPKTKEFENDKTIRNKNGEQPSPFIIRTFPEQTTYRPGEIFSFDITLVGKSVECLPYIVYALDIMCKTGIGKKKGKDGKNGKCLLHSIYAIDIDEQPHLIYQNDNQLLQSGIYHPVTLKNIVMKTPYSDYYTVSDSISGSIDPPSYTDISSAADEPAQSDADTAKKNKIKNSLITFKFNTRLEIKEKGRQPVIDFDIFFRKLLARTITMARLHCGIAGFDSIDFKGVCRQAKQIETVSYSLFYENARRYSSRQKRRTPFGGLIGEISFKGDFTPFWPILLLGEKIHIGKKISFGFGNYTMQYK